MRGRQREKERENERPEKRESGRREVRLALSKVCFSLLIPVQIK